MDGNLYTHQQPFDLLKKRVLAKTVQLRCFVVAVRDEEVTMAIKSFTSASVFEKVLVGFMKYTDAKSHRGAKASYDQFLQINTAAKERSSSGLQAVFESVFPIRDFSENGTLEFVSYELEEPKYDVEECQLRGMTYAVPLKLTLRLVVFDLDEDTGARSIRDIKEQDVYMGDMPLMTDNGTFVVNGLSARIVHKCTDRLVSFSITIGKTHSSGKLLFAARVIHRGSWLDFEFDAKDLVYVKLTAEENYRLQPYLWR